MADFEEPKEFAFGDLNPVQKRRTTPSADPGSMSILDALKEVVTSHYTPDSTRGTGPYKGIVLRVEEEMDQNNPAPGNWLSTVFGPQGMFASLNPFSVPKTLKRYKVRIPEIHVTLPSPQKYAQDPKEQGDHQKIINMYPTFVAADSNAAEAGPGDIVWVDFGNKENFEDPTYIGPVFPPPDAGSGGSGGSGGGASGSEAFGSCGGGAGLSGASGGSIKPNTIPITEENAKWKNGMYLSDSVSSSRNKKDPMKSTKLMAGYGFSTVKDYISKGGSGRAVSGKMALGCCGSMQNVLASYLTAQRIAVEDQADRGYSFGGKPVDPTKGGVDCSGFVHNVRSMTELMVDGSAVLTDGGYDLVPDDGKNTKSNWRKFGWMARPWYGSLKKPKINCTKHKDGWDWVEPTALVKAGLDVSNSDYYKNYLERVCAGEFGDNTSVPTNYFDVEGSCHLMPGDEIALTKPEPPSWAKSQLGISHIMVLFTDPDGNLRLAESGGSHGGTGSMPVEDYVARAKQNGRKLWVWQRPEWSRVWSQVGGRPNQPWTPELCRQLAGDEYFGAPSIAKAATEDGATTEVKSEDGTTTEKAADAEAPKVEPAITAQNITRAQALTASENDDEREEIMILPNNSDSAQFAETVGGKRAIAKSLEEAKVKQSTPAAESTAAQNTTPSASPAPVPIATCGGGSYTPGAPFTIGADRAGAPIGDVPFIGQLGEIRTNPKMKKVKVQFDRIGKQNWYADPRVREDVAVNVTEVKRIANELGALLGSSGASRSLSAKVTPGRSATSFHYTSLALDLVVPAMMNKPETDNFVIEFDPENTKNFIVWARSSKTSGSVEKSGVTFEVEHKTLNGIKESKQGPQILPVTGYFVNVTKLMRAHGLDGIGAVGKNWYKTCSGASEAWHFDFRKNGGLTIGSTTFGMTLETVHNPSSHPPWQYASRVWRGGSFK